MTDRIYIPAIASDGSLYPIEKMQAHLDGQLHLAVSVFVFDGDLLLIQKRASRSIIAPASGPIPAARIRIGMKPSRIVPSAASPRSSASPYRSLGTRRSNMQPMSVRV